MAISAPRLIANQANAQRSTGPKTAEGKAASRRNGMKHGLSGQGVVLPQDDAVEVERRNAELQEEMAPRSAIGQILVRQLAVLSVKMERGGTQEMAAIALRVRHAPEAFDRERVEAAEALMASLADDPRRILRKLRKSPEGVDLLIEAWDDLRALLTDPNRPRWGTDPFAKVTSLMGLRADGLVGTRLYALSNAAWGNLTGLSDEERTGMDLESRKAWARGFLIERIDAEIAALEAHHETLDHATIEADRAEAGVRALFDPSREACLARRYESEARRGFFRALDQLRQVEAEVAEVEAPKPAEVEPENPSSLGSSRKNQVVAIREPRPTDPRPARTALEPKNRASRRRNRGAKTDRSLVGAS